MTRYLLLKHYRGGRPSLNDVPAESWGPGEWEAHVAYMRALADRLRATGECLDVTALGPGGVWVRYDGQGRPAVTEGPFDEAKALVAGWMMIEVGSYERALEIAAELSAAPGAGGRPLGE